MITRWSPVLLRMELDRWLWTDVEHVGLKRVWQCLTSYLYLPRLSGEQVLLDAVREGLRSKDYFAYAASVAADGKYVGLQVGSGTGSIFLDGQSVLVKPEAAARQIEAEAAAAAAKTASETTYVPSGDGGTGVRVANGKVAGDTGTQPPPPKVVPGKPTAFHGSVQLDALRVARDAGNVAQEVIQHLTGLMGAEVTVTLEIHAQIPEGASTDLVRTVTENCRTLKFTSQGFEGE